MSFEGKTAWITGASQRHRRGARARMGRAQARGIILSGRDEGRSGRVWQVRSTDTLVLPFDVRDDDAWGDATGEGQHGATSISSSPMPAIATQRGGDIPTCGLSRDHRHRPHRQPDRGDAGAAAARHRARQRASAVHQEIAGKVGARCEPPIAQPSSGLVGYADALRAELSQQSVSGGHVVCPGSVATDVSRNALTADGSKRGRRTR